MDFDYFDEQGDTAVQNKEMSSSNQFQQAQQVVPQDNADDDEFDFAQPAQSPASYIKNTSSAYEEDQSAIRIREEEERIQERLREKANHQYEQKQKRKEAGRQQLEQFLEQKERQRAEARRQNIQKEKRTREQIKKLNQQAGWKKVGANVPLKQGEYPGKKDINRMRQSIINKRADQSH